MVFDKIAEIIATHMGVDKEDITLDSTFASMQADSIDMVDIIMDIEDEFDVSIESGEGLNTVEDLVNFVEENK